MNPLKHKPDKVKIFLTRFSFCQLPVIFLQPFTDIFPHQEPPFVNMISFRRIAKTCILSALFLVGFSLVNPASAQDGKTLFNNNCAGCHKVNAKGTGPALAGVEDRWPDKTKLHAWIHNSAKVLQSGDKYANDLYNEYNKTAMNKFEGILDDKQIDAILAYIKSVPAAGAAGAAGAANPNEAKAAESDNNLLFGILTLILAVVALTLLQVNANLKKLADEREGQPAHEPIPFWKTRAILPC